MFRDWGLGRWDRCGGVTVGVADCAGVCGCEVEGGVFIWHFRRGESADARE